MANMVCRNRDFATIIPHQPAKYRERHNEVFLDFEAFLLSTMKERSTLWIHSQIKACMDANDCQPEYCLDLFEPSGHGRRRRHVPGTGNGTALQQQQTSAVDDRNSTNFAKFKENIEYTVIMPEDIYHGAAATSENNCGTFLALSGVLGCLLFVAAMILCYLTSRLQAAIGSKYRTAQQDAFGSGRLHTGTGQPSKFPVSYASGSSMYSGRLH
uniref:ZP domain-containing protein n=1 Tax=Schizaphis graminum TaxID=13262 RepID=A0A2S2P553_SCHGA